MERGTGAAAHLVRRSVQGQGQARPGRKNGLAAALQRPLSSAVLVLLGGTRVESS